MSTLFKTLGISAAVLFIGGGALALVPVSQTFAGALSSNGAPVTQNSTILVKNTNGSVQKQVIAPDSKGRFAFEYKTNIFGKLFEDQSKISVCATDAGYIINSANICVPANLVVVLDKSAVELTKNPEQIKTEFSITEREVANVYTIANGGTGILGGVDGKSGQNGTNGANGNSGSNGTNGTSGSTGTNGSAGANGSTGANGSLGTNGSTGTSGTNGSAGANGSSGANGTNAVGATGAQGVQGDPGLRGFTGFNGANGVAGTAGTQGLQGIPGVLSLSLGNGLNGSIAAQLLTLGLAVDTNGGLTAGASGLGLKSTCTNGQILQYNGIAWVCSTISGTDSQQLTYNSATNTLLLTNSPSVTLPYTVFDVTTDGSIARTGTKATGYALSAVLGTDISTSEIQASAVTLAKIATDAVDSSKIVDGSVATIDLANGSVTLAKLAACAADGQTITYYAVDPDGAGPLTVGWNCTTPAAAPIYTGTSGVDVTGTVISIAANGVTTAKLANGSVTTLKLALDAVTTAQILDATIQTADLADDAVTTAKIIDNAITANKLTSGSVTLAKVAVDAINSAKIIDGSIALIDMGSGSVDTAQLVNGSVTTAKLAANAVDLATKVTGVLPVINGGTGLSSITNNQLFIGGAVNTVSQLANGTAGQVLSISAGAPVWTSNAATLNSSTVSGASSSGIFFYDGGVLSQDTANFNYDSTTKKLTVTGGIDPLYVQVKDISGTGAYFESYAGQTAGVSALNTGRMIYNATTNKYQVSANGAAYTDLITNLAVNSVFGRTGAITAQSGDYTTTQVTEGTNLYYTAARFSAALAAKSTTNLAEGANLYYTQARFDTALGLKTTDNLTEGSTNLYYTPTRFNTAFAAKTTTDLAEGTNKYYTDTRADARINLQKGAINGIASLDATGVVPIAQLPGMVLSETFTKADLDTTVGNKCTDLTIAVRGDVCITTASAKTYILTAPDGTIVGNWALLLFPISVSSVNGQNGVVVLTTTDVTEGATNKYYTDARARLAISATGPIAYNSTTGVISVTDGTITGIKLANSTVDLTTKVTGILPTANGGTGLASIGTAGQVLAVNAGATGLQYIAIPSAPVNSVFGRTGVVTATSGDYTSDQVTEGTTNLYYTDARSRLALSATGPISYNNTTGALSVANGTIANVKLANSTIALAVTSIGTNLNASGSPAALGGTLTLNIPDAGVGVVRGLITNSVQTITGVKTFDTGIKTFGAEVSSGTALKLFETTNATSISLSAPTTLATSYALTLPGADGSNGNALVTDGSGALSFRNTYSYIARVATTTNGVLATAYANGQVVDGVTLTTGNIIVLSAQTVPTENGVYTVNASGVPTRLANSQINGQTTFVAAGTTNAAKIYTLSAANTYTPAASGITLAVGTLDSQVKSANGAVISGSNVVLQTADATNPGLVSIGAQTFAGNKTFGANLAQTGTGTFSTGTGAISLNGTTSVSGTNTFSVGTGATTFGGTVTISPFSTAGIVKNSALGVLSSGLINLVSEVSGILPIANGGTNATTASAARTNLGAAALGANSDITSLSGLTTALSIAQGGTGSATQNFVDLTTNQTVAGNKTFSGNTSVGGTLGVTGVTTANGITNTGTLANTGALNQTGVSTFVGNIAQTGVGTFSTGTGAVSLNANTTLTSGKSLTLMNALNTFGTTLKAGANVANVTFALPIADGTAGQFISTDASGNLSFSSPTALTLGTIDAGTLTGTKGANITGSVLSLESATATTPGIVTTTIQTFAGNKTFLGNTTNTGTLTISGVTTANGIVNNTTLTQTGNATFAGNIAQTGVGTFSTGTGAISLNGNTSVTGTNTLTVGTGATTLGGILAVTGNQTNSGTIAVTQALSVKKGTDFATVGTSNDAVLANASLIRLTGAAAQTLTGIVAGSDGQLLTLINAGTTTASLTNSDPASIVANRIVTGTNATLAIPAGASVQLVYDITSTVWRVVGGSGSATSFSSVDVANLATGGNIGTAAATVDIATNFNINQTTASQTVTLPSPTNTITTKGKVITLNNVGTAIFSIGGVTVPAGSYGSAFVWTGTVWNPLNAASNVAAEYGSFIPPNQTLPANYSAVADVVGTTFTLPSAGTWEVGYYLNANNGGSLLQFIITDSANTVVTGSSTYRDNSPVSNDAMAKSVQITTTGAKTYKIRYSAGVNSSLIGSDSIGGGGGSIVTWTKISGNIAVSGQSVDYVYANRTAGQTTGIAIGSPIIVNNTTGGNIPNSSGIFTLTAGKTYNLTGAAGTVAGNTARGIAVRFRDITNNVLLGSEGASFTPTGTQADAVSQSLATAVITPTSNITIRLEIVGFLNSSTPTQIGFNTDQPLSSPFVMIQQLGTSAITGGLNASLSALTAAGAINTIDNGNFDQNWNWTTQTTGNGLNLGATALTTGSLLNLNNSSTANTGLTINAAGSVAYKRGSDYTTVGTSNDANLGNSSLIRLTGVTAQTITGIAGGSDGELLTIINAGTIAATISNANVGSIAANRILTGTGANITLAPDASLNLVYDSGASKWRVVGGTGGSSTNSSATLGDFATGGVVGTASATIDTNNNLNIAQTTIGQALSLPNPTITTAGKVVTVSNTGTAMFTMYTTQISTASPSASFVWNGTTWNPIGGTSNVAAEFGSQTFAGAFTTGSSQDATTNPTFVIPSAGTWDIEVAAQSTGGTPLGGSFALIGISDNSNVILATQNYAIANQDGSAAGSLQGSGYVTTRVVTTGPTTYKIKYGNPGPGGSSTTGSVKWQKLSGNSPVGGQSVDTGVLGPSGSGIVSGSVITLASTSGNIAVGGNLFTLKAGKTYQVRAVLRFTGYTGNYVLYEIQTAAGVRQGTGAMQFKSATSAYSESDQQEAYALITPTVDTTYKIVTTVVETGSVSVSVPESFVSIVQLGTSAIVGGLSAGLNQITAATGTNTIDNTNFAQTWNWGTATTQTGLMALTANTLTTGGLMDLSTSSNAFTSNTGLLSVRNMGTSTTGVLANFQASGINQGLKVFNNGVVGIGTSVAAPLWSNARQVLMLGDTGSVAGASNLAYLANNWYYDGANDRRITTNPVTRMEQLNGGFNFQTAASGAANSVITFTTAQSFENNGRSNFNTASGTTNIPTVSQAQVQISAASGTDGLNIRGAVGNNIINLYAPTTGVTTLLSFRNDQGGAGSENGKIAMTTTTTSYLTASDQRLKTDTGTSAAGLSDLLKIQVRNFKWKSSGEIQNGFYAQQLQTIVPEAVVIGGDEVDANGKLTNPWAVDYGRVTPILVKSIQELNVKVDALAGLDIKTVVKQLDEMKGLQSQNDAAFADIRASLSKLDTRVTSLEKAKTAQDATNTTQEVKLEALQVQLDALKKKIEASSSSAITK